jgi:hypothetical protein
MGYRSMIGRPSHQSPAGSEQVSLGKPRCMTSPRPASRQELLESGLAPQQSEATDIEFAAAAQTQSGPSLA